MVAKNRKIISYYTLRTENKTERVNSVVSALDSNTKNFRVRILAIGPQIYSSS